MNRWVIRGLGVLAGFLGATIFSLAYHSDLLGSKRSAVLGPTTTTVVSEDGVEVPEERPDPGQRRSLRSLVTSAEKESNWLKDFELTERSGQTVRSEDLRGQPYIACFFFTTCPGTCKRQSDQMRLLQTKFRDQPIRLVSISVDPDVDTPEVLSKYADTFGADKDKWLFLTGPLDYIVRVGTEKFFLGGVEKRGHPDRFCLVNADGDVVGSYVWLEKFQREQLVEHANELLKETHSQ